MQIRIYAQCRIFLMLQEFKKRRRKTIRFTCKSYGFWSVGWTNFSPIKKCKIFTSMGNKTSLVALLVAFVFSLNFSFFLIMFILISLASRKFLQTLYKKAWHLVSAPIGINLILVLCTLVDLMPMIWQSSILNIWFWTAFS